MNIHIDARISRTVLVLSPESQGDKLILQSLVAGARACGIEHGEYQDIDSVAPSGLYLMLTPKEAQ